VVDCPGPADLLNKAQVTSTGSGGRGGTTFDSAQAVGMMLEKHGIACDRMHGCNRDRGMPDDEFGMSKLLNLEIRISAFELSTALIPAGREHILKQDDTKKRSGQVVTEHSHARFGLAAGRLLVTVLQNLLVLPALTVTSLFAADPALEAWAEALAPGTTRSSPATVAYTQNVSGAGQDALDRQPHCSKLSPNEDRPCSIASGNVRLRSIAGSLPTGFPMTRALIFDLDNCLAAANEVGEQLFEPAFGAIRRANRATLSDEALNHALADCWRHPLDWVAAKYGFSAEMLSAGWNRFAAMEVTQPMPGYGDLAALSELPVQRFLVTSGFRRLQESKIKALNLGALFTAAYVDAIDEPDRIGKQGLFERILKDFQLTPAEVLVIGDTAESEIEAGNRLGIRTVQTLRPGVPRADKATFHIRSLTELKELLESPLNKGP
jgi:FMN phosphatase YigB (HAD superfamily)